ncbi:hypothetical protein MBT84_15740 [Streptomyces sp. MBT84]|nr:hypothetical protein [Streptomyces sp. MBT84]REE63199.1 hypothetical protein BX257_5837 [Streptomyces sp. 3212.3]
MSPFLYRFNGMLVTNIPYAKENFRVANYSPVRRMGSECGVFTVH